MLRSIITLGLMVSVLAAAASVSPYEWEKERSRIKLSKEEQAMTELVLKNHLQYEYVHENDQFLMYQTVHKIILANSNEAIQKHNRIYISMNSTIDLTDLKARSIAPSGKVTLFDKSNLKELKDEEGGQGFRIFAIEGVELGSEIEYYYTRKMYSSLFNRVYLQGDVQAKDVSFVLSCPEHLKFDLKPYFGLPAAVEENKDGRNIYTLKASSVPALKEEPFAYTEPHRQRVEFKLAYNTARSRERLYTWDEAGKTFFRILNTLEKEDEKALAKFVKSLGDQPSQPLEARIKNVETKVKSTIQINKESSDEPLKNVASILKYKVASREGISKLFVGIFNSLGIKNNIVITCSREEIRFDPTFDTWNYLDEYLLYFPDTKGFLAPYYIETKYPLVPAQFTAQKALFVEPFTLGEMRSGLASVGEIPAPEYTFSSDNLNIVVDFDADLSANHIKLKREFSGYNASFVLPYHHLMTEEQRAAMVEEIIKQTAPDARINEQKAHPSEKDENKYIFDVSMESAHFIEKAGPRLLFKVGTLIGPQTEMYRDDKRQIEIENDYNRGYDRVLEIRLPKGYIVKNPQDLKIDVAYKENSDTPFLFKSDYTLEGSTLKITIAEYYKKIFAPVDRYEEFRNVINAAADFNKITLVLEKSN